MSRKPPEWYGQQDWTTALPLWHPDHPLFQKLGPCRRPVIVSNEFGATEITVPDVGDQLRPVVAAFAVHFEARFAKAHRVSPYAALEAVAYLYCVLGGTPEAWREFLRELGVTIAPQ